MSVIYKHQILLKESSLDDISLKETVTAPNTEIPYKEKFAYKEVDSNVSDKSVALKENPIVAIDGASLIRMDIPPKELLMSPWLPQRGIAMIYAPRGIGKTFLALEVAIAVATGTDLLNWKTNKAGKVLYIDGEMGGSDLQPRIKKLLRGRVLEEGVIKFISPDFQIGPCPDLSLPEWHAHISPFAEEADLIIVDNISTICRTGNENDAESWMLVQEWAIQQKSAGKTVLFIHHAGKGGQQRGTSKREDVMDTVISLKRPDDYTAKQGARFIVEFEKARGFSGDDAESFIVQLEERDDNYTWSMDSLEESLYKKILNLAQLGMSQRDIAEELGIHKSTVSKNISTGKDEGLT